MTTHIYGFLHYGWTNERPENGEDENKYMYINGNFMRIPNAPTGNFLIRPQIFVTTTINVFTALSHQRPPV